MNNGRVLLIVCAILMILATGPAMAQVTQALTDTVRYMPLPHNLLRVDDGWEIVNQKKNVATRAIASQSITGYRYIIDRRVAPRTGLTFQAVVTVLRPDSGGIDSISKARAAYQNQLAGSRQGYFRSAEDADFGDESFIAFQNPARVRVFVRRGEYLIDITGSRDTEAFGTAPDMEETARFMADFIDSRIFGARIGIVRPIQVLNDPSVPLVAGKKMVVYLTVETERGTPFPGDYLLTLNLGKRGFNREEYSIPLGSAGPVEFDPVSDKTDGVLWERELAEPVSIGLPERSAFRLVEEENYRTHMYRFFLDPADPKFFGDYNFRVTIVDPARSSRLRERVVKAVTRPSKSLRVAVMPLPVGYWAPPEKWDVEDWDWVSRLEDRGWERRSFVRFAAPLPENTQRKFTMYPRVRDYLKNALPRSAGERRYSDGVRDGIHFTKGVFPLAEESFEIHCYQDFPQDIVIEPFPENVDVILKALEEWNQRHPRFHRVIGILPGSLPRTSGLDGVYLDENIGQTYWFRGKHIILPVEARAFEYPRELARTFGAVSGWMTPDDIKFIGPVINTPAGSDGGQLVNNGFWPQAGQFQGLPVKPVNSIMGRREPAWITGELFRAISEKLTTN